MDKTRCLIKQLPHGEGLALPHYATAGAAGMDIAAAVAEPITLMPQERIAIPTGFALAIPLGFEMQIRPRSGLALHYGLTTLNAPGTIDSDYRGEVKIILINLGGAAVAISRGMHIAQMVLAPVMQAEWQRCDALPDTHRGSGGFGSTGSNLDTGIKEKS